MELSGVWHEGHAVRGRFLVTCMHLCNNARRVIDNYWNLFENNTCISIGHGSNKNELPIERENKSEAVRNKYV